MNITIQSIHFSADSKLRDFIEDKSKKLVDFYDGITDIQVSLKLENKDDNGNKLVEYKVLVPKDTILASQKGRTFEEATDVVLDNLKRQLKKYKAKRKVA